MEKPTSINEIYTRFHVINLDLLEKTNIGKYILSLKQTRNKDHVVKLYNKWNSKGLSRQSLSAQVRS